MENPKKNDDLYVIEKHDSVSTQLLKTVMNRKGVKLEDYRNRYKFDSDYQVDIGLLESGEPIEFERLLMILGRMDVGMSFVNTSEDVPNPINNSDIAKLNSQSAKILIPKHKS